LKGLKKDKGASILRAKQLNPTYDFRATSRSKKDHDGKAESFLIGMYGVKQIM